MNTGETWIASAGEANFPAEVLPGNTQVREPPDPPTFMKHSQLKSALGRIIALITLAGGLTSTVGYAGEATTELSPGDILDKVRANYAALTTYADEGRVVVSLSGNVTTTSFDMRLARPNFYRVRWIQAGDSSASTQTGRVGSVWSTGAYNQLQADFGLEDEDSPEIALGAAASLSAGATEAVPLIFLSSQPGDALGDSAYDDKRLADGQVGKVDCYVVTRLLLFERKTFWIGKQDFLIRQIQTVTGVDLPALPAGEINWQTMLNLQLVVYTETHGNIKVNEPLQRSAFIP